MVTESESSGSEATCGKMHLQPMEGEIKKCQSRCVEKWSGDLPPVIAYHQQHNIFPQNTPDSSNVDHSDYLCGIFGKGELQLIIRPLTEMIKEYEDSTNHLVATHLAVLKTLAAEQMGNGEDWSDVPVHR